MTPSLEGWPTKAKQAPSPHEVRLAPLDTNPVFQSIRGILETCKNFNKKISTTSAEVPCCNGICERHNAIFTEILLKAKDDIVSGIPLLLELIMLKIYSLITDKFAIIHHFSAKWQTSMRNTLKST